MNKLIERLERRRTMSCPTESNYIYFTCDR